MHFKAGTDLEQLSAQIIREAANAARARFPLTYLAVNPSMVDLLAVGFK
jgi:hypothetical protein